MKRSLKFLIPIVLLAVLTTSFKTNNDNEKDKILISILKYMLTKGHYEPQVIDDAFSVIIFDDFIDNLDPAKRYFLQSDINEFSKYKTEIDDQILNEDISFFNLVFNRFTERIEDAKGYYKEILKTPYDFTKNEILDVDYDKMQFAKSKEELHEAWEKQLKYSTLSRLHNKLTTEFIDYSDTSKISDLEREFRNQLLEDTFVFENNYQSIDQIKQIQKLLIQNNINLGSSGVEKDGVDGLLGSTTLNGILKYKTLIKSKKKATYTQTQFDQFEVEARNNT